MLTHFNSILSLPEFRSSFNDNNIGEYRVISLSEAVKVNNIFSALEYESISISKPGQKRNRIMRNTSHRPLTVAEIEYNIKHFFNYSSDFEDYDEPICLSKTMKMILFEHNFASKTIYNYSKLAILQFMNVGDKSAIILGNNSACNVTISYNLLMEMFRDLYKNKLQPINQLLTYYKCELIEMCDELTRVKYESNKKIIDKKTKINKLRRQLATTNYELSLKDIKIQRKKFKNEQLNDKLAIANAKIASLTECHIHSDWYDVALTENDSHECQCTICFTNRKQVLFGCGHYCCCFECSRVIIRKTKRCPICRTKIEVIHRVYV